MDVGYEVKIIMRFGNLLKSWAGALKRGFDIRDFLVLGGIAMLGYGLYLKWGEWLAYIVCGVLLMLVGYVMNGDK